ncbi:DUF805 domain-containing protein [Streptomyces collinus]|uniref:DUF805 domain-containing protein n=1 Tax=Streptomyces collinus TaxID=42684 RepID=UPI0029428A2A|nr:DUF805 domain-containing protein [Streptomyces collinus]
MSWFIAALKKYAVFKGRAQRKEYWLFMLFVYLIYGVLGGIGYATHSPAALAALFIALIGFMLPTWAVTVRRLHDSGLSGWMILITLVPTVGAIVLVVLCCTKSNEGANKYGPNPKEAPALA